MNEEFKRFVSVRGAFDHGKPFFLKHLTIPVDNERRSFRKDSGADTTVICKRHGYLATGNEFKWFGAR